MCGFVGYFGRLPCPPAELLQGAAQSLLHRGPDAGAMWQDTGAGVAIAHRRLAVVDLSPAGLQPMHSACGRFVIAYNGEIYNHRALRRELDAADGSAADLRCVPVNRWRGSSDTETLLACIERWGLESTLSRLVGMFAFALWDRERRTLTLVRDRMGEKPLYYGWVGAGLAFASELKAIRALPGFDGQLSTAALAAYMARSSGAVPAPLSIYDGVFKLLPGTRLTIGRKDVEAREVPRAQAYWSLASVIEHGRREALSDCPPDSLTDLLEDTLGEAVASQMLADVGLGAFLSGGIDSSLIVALMQARSTRPVKTFSIGFRDPRFDESAHAAAIASHLGSDHCELVVEDGVARDVVPRLPSIYCEPFADRSQIPTVLVSELARREVTVCLSGDGGDELFGGYRRYREFARLWRRRATLPRWLRRVGAAGLGLAGPDRLAGLLAPLAPAMPTALGDRVDPALFERLRAMLASDDVGAFYEIALASAWPQDFVRGRERTAPSPGPALPTGLSLLDSMMASDQLAYLPDDILAKVDRAAMAASLETRIPMLDVRVVELAWRLPRDEGPAGSDGKQLLRRLLARYVPEDLSARPKQGFGVPIDEWLRGPLREWAHALLDPVRLRQEGLFDARLVEKRWRQHQDGTFDWQFELWNLLMFMAWTEQTRAPSASRPCGEPLPLVIADPTGHGPAFA